MDYMESLKIIRETGDYRIRNKLVKSFIPIIRKYAQIYSGEYADYDELLAEGLMIVNRCIDTYRSHYGFSFYGWVLDNIKNLLFNYRRDRYRHYRQERQYAKSMADRHEEELEDKIRMQSVMEIIDLLPASQKTIMEMFFGIGETEAHSLKEIGEILNMNLKTVWFFKDQALDFIVRKLRRRT